MSKAWEDYERQIHNWLKHNYPNFDIRHNVKVVGKKTGVPRQIDIQIKARIAGFEISIIIDAKFHKKNIDVKDVEEFIGMMSDVGANKGIMITPHNYSTAALNRAQNDDSDIELDILSLDDLKFYQGFIAIPYAGDVGLIVSSPLGWIIDATNNPAFLASFYRRGLDFNQACKEKEWMYVNFWRKDGEAKTIEELISKQNSNLRSSFPDSTIQVSEISSSNSITHKIRVFDNHRYPTKEYTAYRDCGEFIAFFVLFCTENTFKRNFRKLSYILETAIPIKIKHENEE